MRHLASLHLLWELGAGCRVQGKAHLQLLEIRAEKVNSVTVSFWSRNIRRMKSLPADVEHEVVLQKPAVFAYLAIQVKVMTDIMSWANKCKH